MSAAHPGLTEELLTQMLDLWLLTNCGVPSQGRAAGRELAERLAAFIWRLIEPQTELGFKPPFGGARRAPEDGWSTGKPRLACVGELDPLVGPCGTCGIRHRVGACPSK